ILDVDSFALETLYEENYAFDRNEVALLINIGASFTSLNAVKGGASIFTRDVTLGGNFVTEAIAKNLSIPFEEAEEAKINGLGDDQEARTISRNGLIAYADVICSEIERSVDYFRTTVSGEIISQVLLSGGGALIPGMTDELSRRLGLEVEMLDPFKSIGRRRHILEREAGDLLGPVAAVSMGLALRKIGDKA
ncbi:MAG: pilus assembly protein PilM, partial [Thermodesulfobacteriota bacterium]